MTDTRLSRQPGRARTAQPQAGASRATVSAERRIEQLQDSVRAHQQRSRALQAQVRLLERSIADQADLEDELTELKGEIRELTRANREHVKRNEALQVEIAKLKKLSKKNPQTDA